MHDAKLASDCAREGGGRSAGRPGRGSPWRWATISAVFTAFMVVLLPAAASAATGAPVTFDGTVAVSSEPSSGSGAQGGITNTGAWTATGAVTGSFAVSEQTWFGGGTVHYVGTLSGANGTITVDVQARFVGFNAPFEDVKGVWVITSGTGAYAGLHGTGDYAATVNVSTQPKIVTESLTGAAEYASGN